MSDAAEPCCDQCGNVVRITYCHECDKWQCSTRCMAQHDMRVHQQPDSRTVQHKHGRQKKNKRRPRGRHR